MRNNPYIFRFKAQSGFEVQRNENSRLGPKCLLILKLIDR